MRPTCFVAVVCLAAAGPARALGPNDVFLVANRNVPESVWAAYHYCAKRGVPEDRVIKLPLPKEEDISRKDYDRWLAGPLREALKDRREQARVLLCIYGVPLRVGAQEPNAEEKEQLAKVGQEIGKIQAEQKKLQDALTALEARNKDKPSDELARSIKDRRRELESVQAQLRPLQERQKRLSYAESQAAVDSELSLLWWDKYELRRWQINLLNFQVPEKARKARPPILMVSRLDGPSFELAKKLVDQAVEVEANGLAGKVYVDARGIGYDPKADSGFGYGGYDESLREMARLLDREAKLPVVLDDKPTLFPPGSCPDCALYCGWYSLANYVDSFKFAPGAVAYHIASSEAVTLRDPGSKLWCKCLLERGVIATLGPVAEPYTIGFPKPAEFFGLLATGRYTLVECYYKTAYLNSWMTVLVGDPLYNPFGKHPKLAPEKMVPSPKAGKPFFRANLDD